MDRHFVEKTMKVYVEVEAKTAADAKRIVDAAELEVVKTGYVESTFDVRGHKERSLISCKWNATKPRWIATICPRCGGKKMSMRAAQCVLCNMRDEGHFGGWKE